MAKHVRAEAKQNITILKATLASEVTESVKQEDTGALSQQREVGKDENTTPLVSLRVPASVGSISSCR